MTSFLKLKNITVTIFLFVIVVCALSSCSSDTKDKITSTSSSTKPDKITTKPKSEAKAVTEYSKSVDIDGSLESLGDTQTKTDTEIGKLVPTFTAKNFQNKAVTVEPNGKPYVLLFVAHWCQHCQREVPVFVNLFEDDKLPENVDVIAVATATDDSGTNYPPSSWLQDEDWPWTSLVDTKDNELAAAFGVTGFPFAVYVNGDGTIASRTSGEQTDRKIISLFEKISKIS